MFETEADEKRDMPLEEGKGPGAEDAPPGKDPSPAQELPAGRDPPPEDSSSEQEPTPGQESPSSKDSPTCKEPPPGPEAPLSEDCPAAPALLPCQDLPAAAAATPGQDPPLSKDLADIPEPPAQDLPAGQGLPPQQVPPPAEALAEETPRSGEPPAASRPAFVIPEVRLDRTYSQKAEAAGGSSGDEEEAEEAEEGEEGEEDEDEDTSDDNYGEHSEAKRSSMIETGQGAEGGLSLRVQNSLRRRTHSEGSLLQEARGPCFSSDTTLHCSDGEGSASTWAIPSPRTLKKELGRNGGSMHHLSLFFTGHRKVRGGGWWCVGPGRAVERPGRSSLPPFSSLSLPANLLPIPQKVTTRPRGPKKAEPRPKPSTSGPRYCVPTAPLSSGPHKRQSRFGQPRTVPIWI